GAPRAREECEEPPPASMASATTTQPPPPDAARDDGAAGQGTEAGDADGSAKPNSPTLGPQPLPSIVVNNRQLRDVCGDALNAIVQSNQPPEVFARGNRLVRLRVDVNDRPVIDACSVDA